MTSKYQVERNIIRALISDVRELYPDEEDGADRLLLVLQIYEWYLSKLPKDTILPLDELMMLKRGIRQAELLLTDIMENEPDLMAGWYAGITPTNAAQDLCNRMHSIIMHFTQEVVETEALFPELKPMFDRERAEYRKRLQEELQAEQQMTAIKQHSPDLTSDSGSGREDYQIHRDEAETYGNH